MIKKSCIKLVSILLMAGLVLALPSPALATSIDRLSLCNLEGHPGETIQVQITLQGTEAEERSGYWDTLYKVVEGDSERMDITSWVTIEPEEYTITQGQSIVFTVRVKIPGDAEPGLLWGATSEEAGKPGQSALRRTYLIFKDTPTGGNVYSGLLIPISVKVLGEASPAAPPEQPSKLAPILSYIQDNIIVVALGVIIIILLIWLLARTTARRTG